jgi:hypothetical protein
VRLTVDGKQYTQPLTLRLDPRVTTPAAGLAQLAQITRETYDAAVAAHVAYEQARALSARLERSSDPAAATLRSQVDAIAPAETAVRRGGRPFGGGGAAAAPTLESASNALMAAVMAMQGADVTPTAGQVATARKAIADSKNVMAKWTAIKAAKLASE